MAGHRRAVAATTAALTLGLAAAAAAHDGPSHGAALSAGPADAHAQLTVRAFPQIAPTGALAQGVEHVGGDNGFPGGHVAIEGDRLYLGSYGLGLRIYDIADAEEPKLVGQYTPGLRADAPPDAAVFDGRHIAVLNGTRRTHTNDSLPPHVRTDRTEWLDVTDPAKPKLLATVGPDQRDGESHNGDIVDERRLYFPSGGVGAQGLRIYDVHPLLGETPAAPANVFRGDPTKMWEASPYRGDKPIGAPFTHTHDITVYTGMAVEGLEGARDIALLAEAGSYTNPTGDAGSVFVIDVTDPRAPVVLQRWLHERGPGHHPIRYLHEAQLLDGDRSVMLVTDEDLHNGCGGAGGVVAVRLSANLREATELSEWFVPLGTPAPVCSVHVLSSEGSRVFFGSYNAGLQVVDYTDPAKPSQAAQYIAEGATAWGAQVHEDVVYVGDMSRGLDVFRVTDDAGADEDARPSSSADGKPKDKAKGKGKAPRR